MDRRRFVRTSVAGAALARVPAGVRRSGQGPVVAIVTDPRDGVAASPPVRKALDSLRLRLVAAGASVRQVEQTDAMLPGAADDIRIMVAGAGAAIPRTLLRFMNVTAPSGPESLLRLASPNEAGRDLIVFGSDARGLSYALRELTERIRPGNRLLQSLAVRQVTTDRPANPVRSVMRQFTSEPLDKPWFYDRDGWSRYLEMLATHRFNRLHLAFGLGYDSLQRVTDSYLLFAYPFLLDVTGYPVRVTNLDDAERARNLETLVFISEEAVSFGLDFELGLWMHGYQLGEGSLARHVVEGLTSESHASYCRDALRALLRACPAVSSVGLRIHGESGVAEGSYDFWGTVFDGVARAGRRIEIDLHAKGIDATMIARAQATGMPVNVSPKFAAEHMGLPYHQAAIRELEMPVAGRTGQGLMTLSEGARVFTRYGYADLLREDRSYTVRPRVFSGTQRILSWGNRMFAAALSESFQFCGMTGGDLMEPLTARGRRGTGVGRRDGYADAPGPGYDWQKYAAWYRTFGRKLYDPDTPEEVFDRDFDGYSGRQLMSALESASILLPLVTQAHLPSAACDAYWPELYWNQPIVEPASPNPYFDTPLPPLFQNVSPLDPQLFASVGETVTELLGDRSGRYLASEVAGWLDGTARVAMEELIEARERGSAEERRIATDVAMLVGLGRFFGAKLRAATLYVLHERTSHREALEQAVLLYRQARTAWADVTERGRAYQADLSASDRFDERGHWADRLLDIDIDIERMAMKVAAAPATSDPRAGRLVREILRVPSRDWLDFAHTPVAGLQSGQGLTIELVQRRHRADAVRLWYRHVNQAERWQMVEMQRSREVWRAAIPASYADSPFPLQYYFSARLGPGYALFPMLLGTMRAPYYVVRRSLG